MNLKNLAMWGIIVFLTIGLYNMFKNPQSNIRGGNQVIFSEFLTSVENGEVLKVEIQGNNIKGVYSNGNSFSTYSPNDPNLIEKLSDKEFLNIKNLSYVDLATEIISRFTGDFCSNEKLHEIVKKSYSTFNEHNVVKIKKVEDLHVLELFHGPTLAFKDVAMQLIGNFYEYYLSKNTKKINIIVATSGDTGAAAIDAVKGKKNINIFVLI